MSSRRQRSGWKIAVVIVAVVVVLGGIYAGVQLLRAAPHPTLALQSDRTSVVPGHVTFPNVGAEATVGLLGVGNLESVGGNTETPIASVTKLMSALVILHDHPLSTGASGPLIPITPADVTRYQQERAAQDSVIPVQVGEHLTEYQALEAALVPSADNVIELLAQWDAGSTSAFVAKMNAEAHALGLTHTHYAGPSGVNPGSVSDAADQAAVATLALENPIIAGIVAQPQVTLPVAGLAYNVNADLGHDGIYGVKTGWVPQGGASFVFAAHRDVAGKTRSIVGALVGVLATPNLPSALADARKLVVAAGGNIHETTVLPAHFVLGELRAPWGGPVPVETAATARLLAWPGATVTVTPDVHPGTLTAPVAAGTRLGTATVSLGSEHVRIPVVSAGTLSGPTTTWRLLHP